MKKTIQIPNHLWKFMKITIYQFLMVVLLGSMAMAHDSPAQEVLNRPVTIVGSNLELKDVLSLIEKQAEVKFVYSTKIKSNQRLTINANNRKLSTVLEEILKPNAISY